MSSRPGAPEPKSALGRHRLLSRSAAVRVSPLCFGAMSLGEAWGEALGKVNKEESFKLLDRFYEMGGNFIDTANNYHAEESEKFIGEWMELRQNRDALVIATKWGSKYHEGNEYPIQTNYAGNSTKNLHESVHASLRKLRTSYIDILYLHWWDFTCTIEELMQSMNQLVVAGKVLYLGISDTPAWVVTKANQYARDHGMRQFCVYQGLYNAAKRDAERDVLPMIKDEGMAYAPWGVLGQGVFRTKEEIEKIKQSGEGGRGATKEPTKDQQAVAQVLGRIGGKYSASIAQIALVYALAKQPHIFPIVGGRKIEHLQASIDALKIRLTQDDMNTIDTAYGFEPGFPYEMVNPDPSKNPMLQRSGQFDFVPEPSSVQLQH